MDRLSIFLTLMTGPMLTGGLTIIAFSLGYYSWAAIAAAVIVGFAACWPAAYMISRRIKRQDGGWDHREVENTPLVPKPGAPEV